MNRADEIRLASSMNQSEDEDNSNKERFISILMDEGNEGSFQPYEPLIRKVPSMMEADKKYYEPMAVSIGPYHKGKPELESMEKLKIPFAQQFFKDSCKSVDAFYSEFVKMAGYARPFYAEGSTTNFNDQDFARLMFLDGCFLLHSIYCAFENKIDTRSMKIHLMGHVLLDFFLLENQIPFIVLKELMRLRFHGDEGEKMIRKFIKIRATDPTFWKMTESFGPVVVDDDDDCHHDHKVPIQLLQLLRTQLLRDPNLNQECASRPPYEDVSSYHSVTDLKAMGIKFKRSCTSHLKDIKFKAYLMHGELSLPPITIDTSTKAKFLNLMAYEILPDTPDDNGVTSYIYFMRALLVNDHDVKELRSECILQNFLMSDDQVVDLFKQLCIGKTINLLVYGSIKSQIHKYCQSKMIRMRIWMVEVKRTYFINPWTVIALLAGVLVVATGTIQTIFTVFPPQK